MAYLDKGPAEITLMGSGKRPAIFTHAGHQERYELCEICHHEYDINYPPAVCDSCHFLDEGESKSKKDDISSPNEDLDTWKEIGHELCKNCHISLGVRKRCGDCHI